MNKSQLSAKASTRAQASLRAARIREALLEQEEGDEFEDVRESSGIAAILDADDDWTEAETEAAHAGYGYRRRGGDFLAPDVEKEISLLLNGVPYR